MITQIETTANLVSNAVETNTYSIGPNTAEALVMKPKKEKNSPLRVSGVILANRLLASAWLPPSTRPRQAPSMSHCNPALRPRGSHIAFRTAMGHQSMGPLPRADGCPGPTAVSPSRAPPLMEMA